MQYSKKSIYILLILTLLFVKTGFSKKFTLENIVNPDEHAINQYWDIVQDYRGIMYFAVPDGVHEYDGVRWRKTELPKQTGAFSLAINEKGRIYVGGDNEFGYLKTNLDGTISYNSYVSQIPQEYQNFDERIVKVEQFDDKVVFFCDSYLFIMNADDESFQVIETKGYFYSSVVINDQMYIIDEAYGLMKYENKELKPVKNGQRLVSYIMIATSDNNVFIVSPNIGTVIFDPSNDSFKTISKETLNYDIKSGIQLFNGNFALGSVSNGCIIMNRKGHELYKINTNSGMLDNSVYCVKQNTSGDLWIGLSKATVLVNKRKDEVKVAEDSTSVFRLSIRSCTRRGNETVIFGGAFLNEKDSVSSLIQPDGQILKFKYDDNNFRFTFATNQYNRSKAIQYQIFLDGLDTAWTTWIDRPYSEYTSLRWGDYELRVRAKNEDGEISKTGTYKFRIQIPWYESWWFFAAQIGFVLSLMVVSGILYRTGKSDKMAGKFVTIALVISFGYVGDFVGSIFALFAFAIALTKFLTNVTIALAISPLESLANDMFEKVMTWKRPDKFIKDSFNDMTDLMGDKTKSDNPEKSGKKGK